MDTRMKKTPNQIRMRAVAVFFLVFLLTAALVYGQVRRQMDEQKLRASYTAEATVRRIESQLNRYLEKSDLLKKMVEGGHTLSDADFAVLGSMLMDTNGVLDAIELAPGGVVDQVYPMKDNEEAVGLDFFADAERNPYAELAKRSGKYTIAGPFDLVQGGRGALLFDPIFVTDGKEGRFWGFSILVVNWERFLEEIGLDSLESASYEYGIYTDNLFGDGVVTIAQDETYGGRGDALTVECEVPNAVWRFEIAPKNGWISRAGLAAACLACLGVALLAALAWWQAAMRQYNARIYAERIQKSAEEAKAANEAKTRFLFNMSHDIRTPMNAIIGFSDLLEKHIDEKKRAMDYIHKIQSASAFLLSIINHVLEMARIESGKESLEPKVFDIPKMVDALEAVFEPDVKEKKLTCRYVVDVRHRRMIGDETKITEIFLNIIGNSVKYTPEGGRIDVRLTEREGAKAGRAELTIVVADTGIGMSESYLPHIFEEFTRERSGTETEVTGTGLGLPIVKSLVDLMDGSIDVQSRAGEGTTTTIVLNLPIVDEGQSEETAVRREKHSGTMRGRRLLLAEDNDLNAEIAEAVLEENGLSVERAEDGQKCVEMLKNHPVGYYDAVLMDIQMPRMNGYQATRAIRALPGERSAVRVIAMTANAFDEDKRRAAEAGMDDYVTKPIRADVLLEALERNLG